MGEEWARERGVGDASGELRRSRSPRLRVLRAADRPALLAGAGGRDRRLILRPRARGASHDISEETTHQHGVGRHSTNSAGTLADPLAARCRVIDDVVAKDEANVPTPRAGPGRRGMGGPVCGPNRRPGGKGNRSTMCLSCGPVPGGQRSVRADSGDRSCLSGYSSTVTPIRPLQCADGA